MYIYIYINNLRPKNSKKFPEPYTLTKFYKKKLSKQCYCTIRKQIEQVVCNRLTAGVT